MYPAQHSVVSPLQTEKQNHVLIDAALNSKISNLPQFTSMHPE